MAKYIKYDLENLEEIKITPTINQSDANFSKSYISGSAVKGACIEKYIIENKIKNLNEGISKELFLKGGLKFLNAYPLDISKKERSLPFPSCYYALKDDIKQQKEIFKITNSLNMEKGKNYAKVKGKEFVLFEKKDLKNISVLKEEYLHIRKPGEKNDENKIFRYEVIKANENFRGYIKVEDKFEEYIDKIKKLLDNTFYIGGSKGSGYGLCKIYNIKVLNENPEYKYFEETMELNDVYFEEEEKIYIYALSDIIYRNKLGQYKTIFDEDFIAKNIGVDKVEVNEECYVDTEYCTSFNNKWGYRQPIISAIKAGSIISYDIKEGEVDLDKVKEFIDSGIGERKNDGYGRFIILNSLSGETVINKGDKKEKKLELEKLDKDKNKQMELILNRIYNSKLESNLPNKVLNIKDNLTGDKEIKTNQWGKLYRLMNILLETNRSEGIKKAEDYFEHINTKQRNRDLANALRKIEVDGKELKDFIISYLKMGVDDFRRSNAYEISLGDAHSSLNEEDVYRYNVRALKELFRLNLRKSKKGEK